MNGGKLKETTSTRGVWYQLTNIMKKRREQMKTTNDAEVERLSDLNRKLKRDIESNQDRDIKKEIK